MLEPVQIEQHFSTDVAIDPKREWFVVFQDQLTDRIGPWSETVPSRRGLIIVESHWWAKQRPHHKQKVAFTFANLRHFAREQASKGVSIRYLVSEMSFASSLRDLLAGLDVQVSAMDSAIRAIRVDTKPLRSAGLLPSVEHQGWLTSDEDFRSSQREQPPWRMDRFYRHVRKRTGILMKRGKPVGGKYSFDAENRESWNGHPPAPSRPRFQTDDIRENVRALIDAKFADHPGSLDLQDISVSQSEAEYLWSWAKEECMADFGPFEDAMTIETATLFHTTVSPLLNVLRLLPSTVVNDVNDLDIPLSSKEGFIRQVLGWREFVRHIHERTDGFRNLEGGRPEIQEFPGSAGWSKWTDSGWSNELDSEGEGGACPNALDADLDLPPAYWGAPSGFKCLDVVVDTVLKTGWSHHITRLMVLSNIATLLDVDPRQLTDWFWVAYIDAYDWVVEPNVLGMGTFAVGDLMVTKPYVSGAAYINRMSDFCGSCRFDPKDDCPITNLYWHFLRRKRDYLSDNPRMRLPLASLDKRSDQRKEHDERVFEWVRSTISNGNELKPEALPASG